MWDSARGGIRRVVILDFCAFPRFLLKEERESIDREEREKEMEVTVHDSVDPRGVHRKWLLS